MVIHHLEDCPHSQGNHPTLFSIVLLTFNDLESLSPWPLLFVNDNTLIYYLQPYIEPLESFDVL